MNRAWLVLVAGLCACAPQDDAAVGQAEEPVLDTAFLGIEALQTLPPTDVIDAVMRRVAEIDDDGPRLNAVLETHRGEARVSGLLAGVPYMLKANIDTDGPMRTHAGSLVLADHIAPDDAQLVRELERSGAILVGTTNLSEWANFRSTRSTSGWSGIGGQTKNPHVLDRNPCGSSSGSAVAVAAGIVPFAIGTETNGSIVCPAGVNGVVGVKPSVGMVSRDGVIPITATQDTPGPFTRSVRDAALVMQVIAVSDPSDPAATGHPGPQDFLGALSTDALVGKRLGVWPGYSRGPLDPRIEAIFDGALQHAATLGAGLVDGIKIEVPSTYTVMLYDFRRGVNDYLAGYRVGSLDAVIRANESDRDRSMPWFGQEILLEAQALDWSDAEYEESLRETRNQLVADLDALFETHALDAVIAPTNAPAWPIDYVQGDRLSFGSSSPAAISGRPSVTIPAGSIHGLPVGVSLIGKYWGDVDLLAMAYALESALPPPLEPQFRPSLETP